MKIFYESGYVNMGGILAEGFPFTFVVGARGTGKTFDVLDNSAENDITFLYMRRTQAQCDLINKPEFSPFKPINEKKNLDIKVKSISHYNGMFYSEIGDKIKPIGYTAALSTIANMRGFSAEQVKRFIYDEFIKEKHEKPLKKEAEAFFNAYETVNRNRELDGLPPLQACLMANSNDISNPIFEELKLIKIADKLQRSGQMVWSDDRRGILLIMLSNSPISQKKKNTALYRLTNGSEFSAMALENDFNIYRGHIKPRPIIEYVPVCSIGELYIYKHKSNKRLYCTTYKTGTFKKSYGIYDSDKMRYKEVFYHHIDLYIENRIDFEDVLAEKLFLKYWDM